MTSKEQISQNLSYSLNRAFSYGLNDMESPGIESRDKAKRLAIAAVDGLTDLNKLLLKDTDLSDFKYSAKRIINSFEVASSATHNQKVAETVDEAFNSWDIDISTF